MTISDVPKHSQGRVGNNTMGRVPTKQLKVPTDSTPRGIRGNFRNGIFSLMVDYALPSTAKPLLLAIEEGTAIMKLLAKDKRVSCVTVNDRIDGQPHYPLLKVCKALRKSSRKLEMLVGIPGRGRCEGDLAKILTELAELRIDSVLSYVGPRLPEHSINDAGIPVSAPQDYLDSAKMIYQIRRQWPSALTGARINPFKYCIEDVHLQYYRMIKGIASGAEFLFTQPGWDMKKLHELQWYMRMRELDVPVIAQVQLLQYDDVNSILRNDWPGIALSREIGAVVQRQYGDERGGIECALKRLGLQVAGCRLLGFSGVSICGCEDALSVELALKYANEALEKFDDFDTWLTAWGDDLLNVEPAPSGSRYYVFKNLLQPETLDFDDDTVELADEAESL